MNPADPVQIQFFKNSCNIDPPVISSGIYIFASFTGMFNFRVDNSQYESRKCFAFISSSSRKISFRGSGSASLLYCNSQYLSDIGNTSFGRKTAAILPRFSAGGYSGFFPDLSDASKIADLFEEIRQEINFKRPDSPEMIQIRLLEVLLLLRRIGSLCQSDLIKWSLEQRVWNIEDVIHYVEENFDGSFSLDDLASRCALNSSYFSRSFKEKAGIPLFEYINRLRIKRACLLLKNSDMTILDIAFSVGYNNLSFFNRYFKRLKDCSPGEYRKIVRS